MPYDSWWDEVYRGEPPWDTGVPSNELVEVLKGAKPCRALDVCCGTGTEAIYLANNGFAVSAIDVSREAIKIAKKKAQEANAKVHFLAASALKIPLRNETFGFINDRGCFHLFPPEDREAFAEEVRRVLEADGIYFMRCFSEKEAGGWNQGHRASREGRFQQGVRVRDEEKELISLPSIRLAIDFCPL